MDGPGVVIALCESLADRVRARAEERGLSARIVGVGPDGLIEGQPPDRIDAILRAAELTTTGVDRLVANYQPRWVHTESAGVDRVVTPLIRERGIVVTRTRHERDVPTAEFAMALILAAAKQLTSLWDAQREKVWREELPVIALDTSTLTIVGYGEIGHAIALRARAFGMRIVGVRRHPRPDDLADRVVGPERLGEALAEADFAVLAAPNTPETVGMIGEAELAALKPTAFLINVGRGETVDEAALDRTLRAERFAGAFLDAFVDEPLPPDHPFWTNPRVRISPHTAGLRAGGFDRTRIDRYLDAVAAFVQGESLPNVVDPRLGY